MTTIRVSTRKEEEDNEEGIGKHGEKRGGGGGASPDILDCSQVRGNDLANRYLVGGSQTVNKIAQDDVNIFRQSCFPSVSIIFVFNY